MSNAPKLFCCNMQMNTSLKEHLTLFKHSYYFRNDYTLDAIHCFCTHLESNKLP